MLPDLLLPSPIIPLPVPIFEKKGLRLWVKREDLIHPLVSGNKWRKLKYNLLQARKEGKNSLLTFGGAYSNHIYATAAAGKALGFKTIGLIRGEKTEPLNPTLSFARSQGMKLIYVSRSEYRQKEQTITDLGINEGEVYILPEGGTNSLALPGCAEIAEEIYSQMAPPPDYICLCCGTGGTMAGLISGLNGKAKVLGFSVLKGAFHQKAIEQLLEEEALKGKTNAASQTNWSVNLDYHFGGYARFSPTLIDFINNYRSLYQLPLDPIYTAKMFYGLEDLAQKGYFPEGSNILAVHTGGLQGVAGFNQRFGFLIDS